MADRRRRRRSSSRYLAPLALAATFAGVYLIVSNGVHSSSPHAGGSANASQRSSSSGSGGSQTGTGFGSARGPKSYVVRAGDTLSEIALRTHVSVTTIERLNPRVTANSLQVGQRLRLRR